MKRSYLKNNKYQILIKSGLVMSVALSGATIVSSSTYADGNDVVDQINITVPVSCTFSGNGIDAHNAEISNGIYRDEIGTTTMKALCNDNGGFAIYAAGFTGDEIGGDNSNKLVGTTASSNATIATGTATGPVGNDDISNWAMKLTPTTGANVNYPITIDNSFSSYSSVPNTYTKVAHRDSGTDIGNNAEGSTFTTTYAAYISKTQPADTYSGKVKYTLVHPSTAEAPLSPQTAQSGCINYFPNGGNVEGTMGCQSITASATSATLLASNFSRTGYGFAGWSDVYDYATNPNAHFYGPQEYITFTAGQYTGTNNGLSLYAVWVKSAGSLQDTNTVSSVCSGLTTAPTNGTANLSSVSALTDQRDNQTYAIAKLADGKCWMIENLRLENTAEHNLDGTLAQGYGTSATYGNFSGLADPEAPSLFNSVTTANSLYSTDGSNDTVNIGTSNASYRFPRYNNVNHPTNASDRPQSPTTNSATNSTSNAGMYSYGNYYTWHAAIADLTPNNTNNQSTTNTSLCPAGWHLPQGGRKANVSVSDFWILSRAAIGADPANFANDYFYYTGTPEGVDASNVMRSYPNNFVYSGNVYSGSVYNRGSYGGYWSSTAYSSVSAYTLYLRSSVVYPGTGDSVKYYGWSIRCVALGA